MERDDGREKGEEGEGGEERVVLGYGREEGSGWGNWVARVGTGLYWYLAVGMGVVGVILVLVVAVYAVVVKGVW